MAIRRPSISSPNWLFQDFLYLDKCTEQLRYLQVKWDGEKFHTQTQTYDYSYPPFEGPDLGGGPIVAQIDYTLAGETVTINDWWVNWRDEWPLRLALNYLKGCLYKRHPIRVAGHEVYTKCGHPIPVADKEAYAFWVSEGFYPDDNEPGTYLYR